MRCCPRYRTTCGAKTDLPRHNFVDGAELLIEPRMDGIGSVVIFTSSIAAVVRPSEYLVGDPMSYESLGSNVLAYTSLKRRPNRLFGT